MDHAQAVAAERERVRVLAEQVLAGVEVADPVPAHGGVAVGHHHLGHAGPVRHRSILVAVAEGDLVQHQALLLREADAELPVLPLHQAAVDREARPLRLRDLDGLEARARRSLHVEAVVAVLLRHRDVALVVDADHAPLREVHVHDQALDRVRPRAVLLVEAEVGVRAHEPPPHLVLAPEEAGRERGAEGEFHVRLEPAPLHGGLPLRRGLHDLGRVLVLLEEILRLSVGGLAVRQDAERVDLAPAHRDDRLGGRTGASIEQGRADPAIQRIARTPRREFGLRRVHREHPRHPRLLADVTGLGQDPPRLRDLVARQRIEGVLRDQGSGDPLAVRVRGVRRMRHGSEPS